MSVVARIGTELIELLTADDVVVQALLYDDGHRRAAGVGVLHVHGKGGNMYRGTGRFLPELLPDQVHLSLNMRCHDLVVRSGVPERPLGGGMYEVLADGHHDLHAAVTFLREEIGVGTVVVAGHSSGGWYAGDYTNHHHDIDARVFLSPLTDNRTKLAQWFPGGHGLAEKRAEALVLIGAGTPQQLVLLPDEYWAIAADTFVERISEPDHHWLRSVQGDPTPILQLFGDLETDRSELWPLLFQQFTAAIKREAVVEGADHSFHGHEHEVAALISAFIHDVTTTASPDPAKESR
jgi:pimeloyl-ACP methyl ester carboxylesterase